MDPWSHMHASSSPDPHATSSSGFVTAELPSHDPHVAAAASTTAPHVALGLPIVPHAPWPVSYTTPAMAQSLRSLSYLDFPWSSTDCRLMQSLDRSPCSGRSRTKLIDIRFEQLQYLYQAPIYQAHRHQRSPIFHQQNLLHLLTA